MTPTRALFALLHAACAVACTTDARFATKFAPNFTPARHSVSVLGVYKDGQMSSEAWDELGPRISKALGGGSCEAAYGGASLSSDPGLSSAIADFVRDNGPTDELLAQLAPAAQGDVIFVLVVAGRLPTPQKTSVQDEATPPMGGGRNMGPGTGGGMGGGRGGRSRMSGGSGRGAPPRDESILQLSASLFSVAGKESVGVVDLEYSGDSVNEAVAKFVERLGQSIPSTTCSGWNWVNTVSPEPIRKLMLQQ
jgi:hypothetical protein